jgi:cytochrome c oxidase cbb3-type subunit 3
MRCRNTATFGLALFFLAAVISPADDSREAYSREMSKPTIRGGIVYKNYCALCHGQRGDGVARATRLYGAVNLAIKPQSPNHYERIIREGGKVAGISPYMPPWEDELSNEQIGDVVSYLGIISNPAMRGEVVYKTSCVLCHGLKADGNGRAATLFTPRPADLTHSEKDDEYKEAIIRHGGKSLGRSAAMPAWDERLNDAEIMDVVAYLRNVLRQP